MAYEYPPKPRPLTILLNGRTQTLKPWNLPSSELERLQNWISNVVDWRDGQIQKAMDHGWDVEAVERGEPARAPKRIAKGER